MNRIAMVSHLVKLDDARYIVAGLVGVTTYIDKRGNRNEAEYLETIYGPDSFVKCSRWMSENILAD